MNPDLELANIPKQSSTVADVLGSGTLGPVTSAVNQAKAGLDIDAVDGEVAKLSSAVGESPAQLVISDSDRTLASTGLGEGSPKVRLQRKFVCWGMLFVYFIFPGLILCYIFRIKYQMTCSLMISLGSLQLIVRKWYVLLLKLLTLSL
jgi:hypothetical protein